jgi:pyrroline-5-carboxylate reductase
VIPREKAGETRCPTFMAASTFPGAWRLVFGAFYWLPDSKATCYNAVMAAKLSIGFLGAGKMAGALARGFIRAGLVTPEQVLASDPSESARATLTRETGVKSTPSNPEVVKFAHTLVLAVKPDQVPPVLADIRDDFTERHLLISIAAGVPLAKLEAGLGAGARLIRVMPNTPALVGASATAFALGKSAKAEDGELAQRLFASIGLAFQLKETLLDAVTGLSGSGPAYIYLIIEALSDGGVAAGLPRDAATKLAAQTVLGSARMVLETGLHPGALKDMVASPGGTTIEGLHELEKGKLRGTLISAVRAATEKSKKLGQG